MKILLQLLIFSFLFISCEATPSAPIEEIDAAANDSIDAIYIYNTVGIAWDKKQPCEIKFCQTCETLKGKIKNRGGISSQYYKHSFSLKLKKDTVLFENWKEDDDYIINATYIDKTMMRHELSYHLFNQLSPQNITSKCAYKQVYLNDNYEGLYVVMEEVDKSLVGIDKNESGSYILKDGGLFREDLTTFQAQDTGNLFQIKHPKSFTTADVSIIQSLWSFLHESSDEIFTKEVATLFDIDQIIDWHILLLLTNNGDGVLKNFYWYKKPNTPWRVVPWDYDDSFGRNGDNTLQTQECGWERNILLKRLFDLNVNDYRHKLITKWYTAKTNQVSYAHIHNFIQLKKEQLKTVGLAKNIKKWPLDGQGYADNATFEEEINLMETWIEQRVPKIDSMMTVWGTL